MFLRFIYRYLGFIIQRFNYRVMTKKIIPIVRDGNCLFRVFSLLEDNTQSRHLFWRNLIVDFIKQHWNHYKPFVTSPDHLKYMSLSGTFGTFLEIQAYSSITKKRIVIYRNKSNRSNVEAKDLELLMVVNENYTDKVEICFSGHLDNGHFEPII